MTDDDSTDERIDVEQLDTEEVPATDVDLDLDREAALEAVGDDEGRRGFGKMLLAGAAVATGFSGTASAATDWREQYRDYALQAIDDFYEVAPGQRYAQTAIDYHAEYTDIFDVLNQGLTLGDSEIGRAFFTPAPCPPHCPPWPWPDPCPDWCEILFGDEFPPFCDPRYCDPPGFIVGDGHLTIVGPEGRADVRLRFGEPSFGYFYQDGDPIPIPFTENGWEETPRDHVDADLELPY